MGRGSAKALRTMLAVTYTVTILVVGAYALLLASNALKNLEHVLYDRGDVASAMSEGLR